eukprot:scaffold11805_cov65-Phaeocystis_antarctica.AAC.5
MFAPLQHDALHARVSTADGAGTSGEGRGFEAHKFTRRTCAACSPACNTEHRTHAGVQPMEPAPAGRARV